MDCFLNRETRTPYIVEIREVVDEMKTNYKIALTDLRFDELSKQDDDVSWLATFALDIASGYLMGLVTTALKNVKANAISRITTRMLDARLAGGNITSLQRHAFSAITNLNDSAIKDWTKRAFDMGKTSVQKGMKDSHNVDTESTKTATVSYIESLRASADTGFNTFKARASADTYDSELLVMWEALNDAPADVETFKALLTEKLGRFKKSGVLDIGRKEARDKSVSPSPSVLRDTRVIWIVSPDGSKELFYESQDGEDDPSVFHPGDPGTSWMPESSKPLTFGPRQPRAEPRIDRRVPTEFQDVALDASRQRWGEVPTYDPYGWGQKKASATNLNSYWFGDDDAASTSSSTNGNTTASAPAATAAQPGSPLSAWRTSVSSSPGPASNAHVDDPGKVPSVLWRPDLLPAQ